MRFILKSKSSRRASATPRKEPSLYRVHFHYRLREGFLILASFIAIFLLVALVSFHRSDPSWSHTIAKEHVLNWEGKVGAWLADVLLYAFGYMAYLLALMLFYSAWIFYRHRHLMEQEQGKHALLLMRVLGFVMVMMSGCALATQYISADNLNLPFNAGGVVGYGSEHFLVHLFNPAGSTLFLVALFLLGATLFSGVSWVLIFEKTGEFVLAQLSKLQLKLKLFLQHEPKPIRLAIEPVIQEVKHPRPKIIRTEPKLGFEDSEHSPNIEMLKPAMSEKKSLANPRPPKLSAVGAGGLPDIHLLDESAVKQARGFTEEQLEARSREVEARLADFNVEVHVTAVHPGPVVTRFELELAAGTKVSKISGLAKDLARSLSVISVRVVEVIPGKSVIGLELPNEQREVVSLKDILSSKQYLNSYSALTLGLGKDIAGHPVVVDLAKMPHLLVAGTTGSGKSVGLNAMLLSLLYKSTPKQLRLILIDPKMLELAIYDGIPHLLVPVVTDMKDAASALRWCVVEMERRYKIMASLGVRNLAGFNAKIKEAAAQAKTIPDPFFKSEGEEFSATALEELPQIVVLADEFADMMVVVGKKVETLIARLAQKARAAGIHLIFATQRPSVDVITGLIKANIPTRIAFQVSSKIDSRTILDQKGAEQLLGYGDMLYLAPGTGVPVRIHGAYVGDDEVHRVVDYLRQTASPQYLDEILDEDFSGEYGVAGGGEAGSGDAEKDPFYEQAVEAVIQAQRVSISSIQRRFKIGYNRAACIVEAMELAGVVGPPADGNGVRDVLVPAREA